MISEEQWWRPQAAMVAAGVANAALLVFLAPTEAQAQVAAAVGGSLDTIVDKFKEATSQWESAIKKAAISLFWILAAIEFAVTALFLVLAGGGFQSLAAEIVKRILVVGIFFFILDQGTSIVDAVIQSFRQLSASAGGAGFKPSDIFNAGVSIAQKLADNVSFWTDTTKSLALLIAALVIVICFALIAAIVIVTMVEMYIVTYAGIILLGFGGSAFTKDYAVKYLTYAVSVGLKLMVMGLVVGIGQSILTSTAQGFQNKTNTEVYIVVGVAIVLLAVTKALPAMLQSIVVGSSVGSNTTLPAAVGTVAGAGAAAVGAMAGAVAVGHAAYKGGGSAGQMAGRTMGAVAGAAFDRVAGMPGSRMGSVMGNAASGLRQQNQQRQLQLNQPRSLTAPGSSGGGSPSSSAAQRASAAFASQGSAARGGRPTTPGDGGGEVWPPRAGVRFPRRGWATSHLPRRWWEYCVGARTSWVKQCCAHETARGGCRCTQTRRPSLTAPRRRDPGNCSSRQRVGDFGRCRWGSISCRCRRQPDRQPGGVVRCRFPSSHYVLRARFNRGHRGADNRRPVCRLGRHNIFQCCRPGPRFRGQRGGPGPLWNLTQLHAGSSFGRDRPNHQPACPCGGVYDGAARD